MNYNNLLKLLSFLLVFASFTASAELSKEERKALFAGATERLKNSGIEQKAPKVGEAFPDVTVGGKKISEWVKGGSLVLTFYRGGWCPYCVKQLKEINESLSKISTSKTQLVAIAPETEMEVQKTKKKNDLNFPMFSDKDNKLARELGIVFKVEDAVEAEYKGFGIDLAASQGNSRNELPIPATFVIGQDQKVKFAFVDADYTKRAATSDIIKSLGL
jgi:peroxiredoxin